VERVANAPQDWSWPNSLGIISLERASRGRGGPGYDGLVSAKDMGGSQKVSDYRLSGAVGG
jgi:hypothetical protein